MVAEGIARVAYDVTAVVAVDAPTQQVAEGIPLSFGSVAEEDGRTILRIGADSPGWLIGYLVATEGRPFRSPNQIRLRAPEAGGAWGDGAIRPGPACRRTRPACAPGSPGA